MHDTLSKTDYLNLRKALEFRRQIWPTVLVAAADLGIILLALWMTPKSSPNTAVEVASYLTSQLLFVIVFFHNFAILHECGHGNCSNHDRINNVVGSYASIFCFMPYFPWKYIHAEHHIWAGNVQRDPTLALIRKYRKSQKAKNCIIRIAWRTWLPLLAFFQHVVFWSYPVIRLLQGQLEFRKAVNSTFSVALLFGSYTAAAICFPAWFNLFTFGPALVFYLVVVELINFPHHMGTKLFGTTQKAKKLPLWEQEEVTRSCYFPSLISNLLLLNFNFHIEHHLFPDLPWYNLRNARELTVAALGERYRESTGISWNIENRRKDATEVFLKDANETAEHWNLKEDSAGTDERNIETERCYEPIENSIAPLPIIYELNDVTDVNTPESLS